MNHSAADSFAHQSGQPRYLAPGGLTRRLFNPLMAALTKAGIGVRGARVLRVQGRSSGLWRETPVNPLSWNGERYLVAPRGTTQWVRNLRAADGQGELRLGRRVEAFTAMELADADKTEVLREYLRRWSMETGAFFGGVGADSPDAELARIAPDHPVFRLVRGA